MDKPKIKSKHGPEYKIQKDIIKFLQERGWYVRILHGSTFQVGLPDLFACKRRYGSRFIEVKNPKAYRFTSGQMETFPRFAAEGVGIWILTEATEREYAKLFQPANWWTFLNVPNMNR